VILDRCTCGKPWRHYNSPVVAEQLLSLVHLSGPTVQVAYVGPLGAEKVYLFSRDYIAQHGLKGEQIDLLGFPLLGTSGCLVYPELGAITCTMCGLTSWNPNDVANRYCGNCHVFYPVIRP
jgi:hypothetical protein